MQLRRVPRGWTIESKVTICLKERSSVCPIQCTISEGQYHRVNLTEVNGSRRYASHASDSDIICNGDRYNECSQRGRFTRYCSTVYGLSRASSNRSFHVNGLRFTARKYYGFRVRSENNGTKSCGSQQIQVLQGFGLSRMALWVKGHSSTATGAGDHRIF